MGKDKDKKTEKAKRAKPEEHGHHHEGACMFCTVRSMMEHKMNSHSQFFEHVKGVEREMLMAIRSLIDDRLDDLKGAQPKRATKIQVS